MIKKINIFGGEITIRFGVSWRKKGPHPMDTRAYHNHGKKRFKMTTASLRTERARKDAREPTKFERRVRLFGYEQ